MHIVYIITSLTDQKCGVVDYTRQLAFNLQKVVTKVTIEELPSWSFTELIKLKRKYKNETGIIFHLQYPTMGMGKSIAPALLNIGLKNNKVFITLHEFEQFNLIRKSYFLLSSMLNTNYIFTNEHERKQFLHFFPWSKKKCEIIPIGNNITPIPYVNNSDEQRHRLVYFGQIAPDKGIEIFLETVRRLRSEGSDIPCAIIGATLNSSNDLLQKISSVASQNDMECMFNLRPEDVSKELHQSSIAYLPFPGGVSDKRGSALACLKHDLAVITTHSKLTPLWWKKSTYHATSPQDASTVIQAISKGKIKKTQDPIMRQTAMNKREWANIATEHTHLYTKMDIHGA